MTTSRLASGLLLLALAASGVGCSSDDSAESVDTDPSPVQDACSFAAKSLSLVVGAIKGGEGAGEVLGLLEPGVALVCEGVVNSWINAPNQPVPFTLQTNTGPRLQTLAFSVLAEPPPPTTTSFNLPDALRDRIVDCAISYFQYEFLNQMCLDHVIEP